MTTHDVHLAIVPADKKHGVIEALILCSLTITAKKRNGDSPLVGAMISARTGVTYLVCEMCPHTVQMKVEAFLFSTCMSTS